MAWFVVGLQVLYLTLTLYYLKKLDESNQSRKEMTETLKKDIETREAHMVMMEELKELLERFARRR